LSKKKGGRRPNQKLGPGTRHRAEKKNGGNKVEWGQGGKKGFAMLIPAERVTGNEGQETLLPLMGLPP